MWENDKHFLFQDHVIGAGKCQAGQVDFHVAHVSSLEISKVCYCGALTPDPELFQGQTTLGNATRVWVHIRPWKVLRKPIGKTAVDFLEQRHASLSEDMSWSPCLWKDQKPSLFSGSLPRLFIETSCSVYIFVFILRPQKWSSRHL